MPLRKGHGSGDCGGNSFTRSRNYGGRRQTSHSRGYGKMPRRFCGPRVMEIIARELDIPLDKVRKGGGEDSNIAVCKVKEVR